MQEGERDFTYARFKRTQETIRRIEQSAQANGKQPTWGEMSPEEADAVEAFTYWPQDRWPRPKPRGAPNKVAIVSRRTPPVGPSKVAIIGKAGHAFYAPWGEEGWELWGMNEAPKAREVAAPVEAHTRWFQLHPPRYLKTHHSPGIKDLRDNWSSKRGVTLYMDKHYSRYPDSVAFPKAEIEKLVPHGWYHASSFDWMLALAIYEGFKHIALYGVNLYTSPLLNGEPLSGRPCLEYWVGVAEGRGAKVEIVGGGDMFKIVHLARMTSELQYGWGREPALDLGNGWRDVR